MKIHEHQWGNIGNQRETLENIQTLMKTIKFNENQWKRNEHQ